MLTKRSLILAAMAAPFMGATATLADTKSVVDVGFWDDPDREMQTGLGYGMEGDLAAANMGFNLSVTSVGAGEVTFVGTNTSRDIEHEMIVAPLAEGATALPYSEAGGRVDEDAAGALGEIEELEPGAKGRLTLHLDPGKYILFCNLPGHYMGGMWAVLTVN